MSQRGVIGLLVALVVLGLLVFIVQRDRSPAASAGAPILPGLQAALNDVERVTIVKAGGAAVATLERRADGWAIVEKGGYGADVAKLRQNLRALAEAKVLETKTSNAAFYEKLGVEDVAGANAAGVAVTIAAAGKEFGPLILGNAVGTKQRYARRASEMPSYLLDRNPDFPKSSSQWLDAGIVDVRGERVQQVTIKHPDGETVTISKREAPPSDLTQGTVVNFDVANVPAGRELLYAGVANVIDIRNYGLVAGIELQGIAGEPAKRAFNVFLDCFDKGVLVRTTGDIIALSPPLIVERQHIDQIVDTLRGAIQRAA